jgi:dUTPase
MMVHTRKREEPRSITISISSSSKAEPVQGQWIQLLQTNMGMQINEADYFTHLIPMSSSDLNTTIHIINTTMYDEDEAHVYLNSIYIVTRRYL